jgi:hypothetical protein
MAKTSKKASAELVAKVVTKAPTPKKTTPAKPAKLENVMYKLPPKGTPERVKWDYYIARYGGGAAKEAAKLTKPKKVAEGPAYSFRGSDGSIGYSRATKYKQVDPGIGTAKEVEQRIIAQKQKAYKESKAAAAAAKLKNKNK